jgi:WS/DGAT/MGAT family acyltransferase
VTPPQPEGRRLSALDSFFLQLESTSAHMHVGWSAICSPSSEGERPTIEALRARADSRLGWVPRARQRVLLPPLGLGEPQWVDDERFDIATHVVALSDLEETVSLRRFAQLRDALLSEPLDRSRPLWQIALIPRLEDGRSAVLGRVHHAMADGTAALLVATLVLDGDTDEPAPLPVRWRAKPAPSMVSRALDPLVLGAGRATRAAGGLTRAALRPRSSARSAIGAAGRIQRALVADFLPGAPETELSSQLGPRRTLVSYRASLADLQACRGDGVATLNDVGLAVVAGALRALVLQRGDTPEQLKTMIPVDMRRGDERGAMGNHIAMVAAWLPLQHPVPAQRLDLVRSETERFKRAGRPAGTQAVLTASGLLPFAMRGALIRAISTRAFNLTVSNVRGPSEALAVLGARIDEIYPVVPIAEQSTLSIGMLSYAGYMHFGVFADPEALPDVVDLPDLLAREVRALQPPRLHPVTSSPGVNGRPLTPVGGR